MPESLNEDSIVDRFASLRQHQRDGKRSPHKPLLVLTALGRLVSNGDSATPYTVIEQQLADLIANFGPPARTPPATSVAYPFTRLRSDGVWQLDSDVALDTVTPLRQHHVVGRFTADVEEAFRASPALVNRVARMLVESQFPETLTRDVLLQAGLDPDLVLRSPDLVPATEPGRRRSASWVRDILDAWDRQCAFCGYDGQFGGSVVGIEAAHVRWFNLGGPDDVDNGMALCSLHHKLFDRGALGLDDGHRVKVSARFTGRMPTARAVYDLHGIELRPRPGTALPREDFVEWHNREVFREEPLAV